MISSRGALSSLVVRIGVLLGAGLIAAALAPAAWALSWSAPTTLTAAGELSQDVAPSTAMDANGDAIAAWGNYHSVNFDCPCQARVALRSAGGAFGTPVTLATYGDSTGQDLGDVHAAMDAAGDAIVVWDQTVGPIGSTGGYEHRVFARVRPAGASSSWSAAQQLSVNGTTADGGGVPQVAMDSAGDAIVTWISGIFWWSGAHAQPQLQVVRRPAGGSFSTPTAVTGSGADGPFSDLALSMSPNGHVAITYTRCNPAEYCGEPFPSSSAQNKVQVVTAAAPAASFGAPVDVSTTVSNPGLLSGPKMSAQSVAIDDSNDVVVTYNKEGAGSISSSSTTHRDEVAVSDSGGSFSTVSLGASGASFAGPAVMGPSGEAIVTYSDSVGTRTRSRPRAGSFGTPQTLTASSISSFLALSSNAASANGEALTGGFGGTSGNTVLAQLRPAGGTFGTAATLGTLGSGFDQDASSINGSIDKLGDAAVVAWSEGNSTNGTPGPIQAALASSAPSTFTLTVSDSGSGSVTSSPAGISCGTVCSHAFAAGSSVSLTPHAATGYMFTGWAGACTGAGACTVAMSANKSVTAIFKPTHTLTVSKSGSGSVTSSPAGISCGTVCTHAFLSGTTVALTPHPASGYRFSSWSGACTGTSTCSVTMSANKSVTATFTAIPPPNTTLTGFTLHNSTRSATISFTGSGGVGALHFLCKLDAGSFLSCSSPKTYTSLGKGSHTIAVEAVDSRGKADPSPATRSFTVT